MRKPEVMSPAGYWPQLRTAIEAGADSVYFGLKHFSARAKVGFTLEELPEAIRALHLRGVKGFVTFNTLVFEHELNQAAQTIEAIAESGADAIIVQDLGILKMVKRIAPDLEIHGSTQMSITSAEGVELARRLGASRVTLARELSLADLRLIRARTDCELEIFVHGALCVAYSGQCFSSEAWGGRSANRGQCAQTCRMPYELLVDGRLEPLADARYLLSPGDLYALRQIPDILPIGISALKIEGRYKDAEYVALATQAYRKAVDEAWAGLPSSFDASAELQLEQVYSRGLGPHFLSGTNHQTVVQGRAPRHRGVLLGTVVRVTSEGVVIEPAPAQAVAPLKPGDGLVFDAADWRSPEEPEEGGRLYAVEPLRGGALQLKFGNNAIQVSRIRPGDRLWRTHDPAIDKTVRAFTAAAVPVRKQTVDVRVTAHQGAPLSTHWTLAGQPAVHVSVELPEPLARSESHPVTPELLAAQFSRLGNTPYELGRLQADIAGSPFIPPSQLNRLRRDAVDRLTALQGSPRQVALNRERPRPRSLVPPPPIEAPHLHLLVRTPEQLEAALDLRPASVTLDFLDLYGLRPSVDRVRATGIAVRVAAPRILKPDEERVVSFLLRLDCPLLVRSTGLLQMFRDAKHPDLTGDFSLNAANSLTFTELLELGLSRITPTHDLNAAQVADLANRSAPGFLEVIAYQHLPVFHTEHCVFCRFLSTGTSYKDCGRPCEKHRVEVRDERGRAHPVMADVGCRNTVFGAEAQDASSHFEAWLGAGIRHFRLEFVHESASQVSQAGRAWIDALNGRKTARQLSADLKRLAPQGLTEGSLFVPSDFPILQ